MIATVASRGRGATFALVVGFVLLAPTAGFAVPLDAHFLSPSIPATVIAGEQYEVRFTIENAGTTAWDPVGASCNPDSYRLQSKNSTNNTTWGSSRLELPSTVLAGETTVFGAPVTAPTTTDNYNFQWQMIKECDTPFGDLSPNVAVAVRAPDPPRDGTFLAQNVPTRMVVGESYPVSFTVKNVGTEAWAPAGVACGAYRLRSSNSTDNTTWGPNRFELPASVAPGQSAVVHGVVTAPTTAGNYNFQWELIRECDAPFGDPSPNVVVSVEARVARDALFVAQSVPTTMAAGQQYDASLTIKNVGTATWSPVSATCPGYRVGSQNPTNNTTWGTSMSRLDLTVPGGVLAANGVVTKEFTVTAPATPGTYAFQWRMIEECVSWFGDLSPNVMVTVAQSWTDADADELLEWDGTDVTVPATLDLVLDTDLDIGTLTIHGKVRCDPARDTVIETDGILVQGAGALLECGTSEARHTKDFTIELQGIREVVEDHGKQAIVVMDDAVLRLHGRAYSRTWLRIDEDADVEATSIHLEKPVDWPNGAAIVIASTTFDPGEAEETTLAAAPSNGGRTLTLDDALVHSHWGTTQSYSNGLASPDERTWELDERAEVGLLSRNIVIRGSPGEGELALTGGHVMIMDGGRAYVDGVEFDHMGRLSQPEADPPVSEMGRYPFHWHLLGNADGQYIRNSSIHHTFQRCVNVHGTNRVVVENNVCYDHLGHGYFLENGSEIENHFVHNLGLLGKRPPPGRELLFSENRTTRILAYDPPATFWIANPNNDFVDNSAAGSLGTGYWFALNDTVFPGSGLEDPPNETNLLRFEHNTAHSSLTGVAVDGAPTGDPTGNPNNEDDREIAISHYSAPDLPVFRRLTIFKTAGTGFWARGDKMEVTDSAFGDNLRAATFSYQQKLSDSLVVGMSDNFDIDLGEIFPDDGMSNAPRGALEAVGSDKFIGWACDPDDWEAPLWVTFYEKTDGVTQTTTTGHYVGGVVADQWRDDDVADVCGEEHYHGFEFTVPDPPNPVRDGLPHAIYAYVFSAPEFTGSYWLPGSPRTLWPSTPAPDPPPSVIPPVFEAGLAIPLSDVFGVPVPLRIWGFGLYDGPWVMEDVHFAGFPAGPLLLPDDSGTEIIASPFPLFGGEREATTNTASGLTFATFDSEYPPPYYDEEYPEPYRKVYLSVVDNPNRGEWGVAIIDDDGSLIGDPEYAGYSVVANHPINWVEGCIDKPEWAAYACPRRYTTVRMIRPVYMPGDPTLTYELRRSDDAIENPIDPPDDEIHDFTYRGQNKFGLIMNGGFEYELYPAFDLDDWTELELFYVNPLEGTPLIRIADPEGDLVLDGIDASSNLASVRSAEETAYFNSGTYLYFKLFADWENSFWSYTGKTTVRLCRSTGTMCDD
jgi:hypothetical protein